MSMITSESVPSLLSLSPVQHQDHHRYPVNAVLACPMPRCPVRIPFHARALSLR